MAIEIRRTLSFIVVLVIACILLDAVAPEAAQSDYTQYRCYFPDLHEGETWEVPDHSYKIKCLDAEFGPQRARFLINDSVNTGWLTADSFYKYNRLVITGINVIEDGWVDFYAWVAITSPFFSFTPEHVVVVAGDEMEFTFSTDAGEPYNIAPFAFVPGDTEIVRGWDSSWTKDYQGGNQWLLSGGTDQNAQPRRYDFWLGFQINGGSKYAQALSCTLVDPGSIRVTVKYPLGSSAPLEYREYLLYEWVNNDWVHRRTAHAVTDPYTFESVPPGTYKVVAYEIGIRIGYEVCEVLPGEQTDVTITSNYMGELRVQTLYTDGLVLPDAYVEVRSYYQNQWLPVRSDETDCSGWTTDLWLWPTTLDVEKYQVWVKLQGRWSGPHDVKIVANYDGELNTLILHPFDAPQIELQLYRVSDTSGQANSADPGQEKTQFQPGDIVRVTMFGQNHAPSWDVPVRCVLNLRDRLGNVVYDSHESGDDNTYDSPLVSGEIDYYSFDWQIPDDAEDGEYDLLSALRDGFCWDIVYDDSEPGINTRTLGPAAWLGSVFTVGYYEWRTIGGSVKDVNGNGKAGVTVTAQAGELEYKDETELPDGTFVISVPSQPPNYTVYCTLDNHIFFPSEAQVDVSGGNVSDVNFVAADLSAYTPFNMGGLHAHSAFSDGMAVPRKAYEDARLRADFFALTDHAEQVDHTDEWEETEDVYWWRPGGDGISKGIKAEAIYQSEISGGTLAGLSGFEWTHTYEDGLLQFGLNSENDVGQGHINILNSVLLEDQGYEGEDGRYQGANNYYGWLWFERDPDPDEASAELRELYKWTAGAQGIGELPVIAQFNHPSAYPSTWHFDDFAPPDPMLANETRGEVIARFALLEIGSGLDRWYRGPEYEDTTGTSNEEYFIAALRSGWHVAPVNNEDNHLGQFMTSDRRTVVLMPNGADLSRASVSLALLARRVYATEHYGTVCAVVAEGYWMGETMPEEVPEEGVVECAIYYHHNTRQPQEVSVIAPGHTYSGSELVYDGRSHTYRARVSVKPGDWFFVKIRDTWGDLTYTAPIWVGNELYSVSGAVTDSGVGRHGIELDLIEHYSGDVLKTALTGWGGHYVFDAVPPGTYIVDASPGSGYGVEHDADVPWPFQVTNNDVGDIDLHVVARYGAPRIEIDPNEPADEQKLVPEGIPVTVYLTNIGQTTTGDCYADVSFPDLLPMDPDATIELADGWQENWDYARVYRPGETLWHRNGSEMTAEHFLVSAFKSGMENSKTAPLTALIRTTETGTQRVFYRGTVTQNIDPTDAETQTYDQQGWPVYVRQFEIVKPPEPQLYVTPFDDYRPEGPEGGPFEPPSKTYWVLNTGGAPLEWTASKTVDWLDLSNEGGYLEPGQEDTVTVSVNSNANMLDRGTHPDTLTFTNTTNHDGDTTRGVVLTVCRVPDRVYVDQNAPGAQDGTTWENAFLTIQAGVNAAGQGRDVWVADGTYFENVGMAQGVQLYGGYAGYGADDPDDRNIDVYVTTINGNKSGSCVVMAVDSRLDGFTITNGDASQGGGIHCSGLGDTGVIANNTITGCDADEYGGGIFCDHSSPMIMGNTITSNTAYDAGAIACRFSSPVVSSNIITNNLSDTFAGAILCDQSSPTITNNLIARNRADLYSGGGIVCATTCSPTITNNSLVENTAKERGGAIFCGDRVSPGVYNNIVAWNSTNLELEGGGIYSDPTSSPYLSHNDFWNNVPDDYYGCDPGAGDISADPLFVNPAAADWHLTGGSPCVDAGTNDAPGLPEYDWEGDDRIVNGIVDMGADEYLTIFAEAPVPQPGCGGPLFGGSEAGFPAWVWFSIPLTPDCVVGSGCADPSELLGFDCKGKLWYWDRYGKWTQVYRPPFLQWDLAVGNSYLLRLTEPVANPSYDGLSPFVPWTFEFRLGRQGWTWVGMPGLEELGYPSFMASVRVMYPSDETGSTRTAQQDYDATPGNWIAWGWAFFDTYLQGPRTFTPYAPFGHNTCYPWVGYRVWVRVGNALDEDDPDQVTFIWPKIQ